ncbi:GNAT family N-acetyltransferase [Cytophagaceae bacterium DM2B3-1]|uniref:GNAT family N-acetyltransferase n=1 Tax=Xanthocytophaga flava TaxID=3048013 RepID=A0ABT7CM53_9BACT|nr:GNAT family N-acetyltransferase [Xanthocytophaga flavus]MDJ1494770.1 GNAT family N-acetyltransferase [Xanthocytophaga flavus]
MTTVALADIQIRNTLQPGDLGYIAYIHGDLYAKECNYGINFEAYVLDGLKEFGQQYDAAKDKVWLCEHQGRIVGCLVAQHRAQQVQLRYFIFLPEYRGIGLGKYLMQEFVRFMHEKGISHAYLWTTDEQHAATALYTRYGFVLTEEKPSESFDKPLTERRYDLVLA